MPKVHVCWVKLQLESAIFYFKIKVSGCASSLAGWPAGNSTTSHQDELFQILSASAFKMERKKKESESQNFESEVPLSAFVWLIFQAVRPLFFSSSFSIFYSFLTRRLFFLFSLSYLLLKSLIFFPSQKRQQQCIASTAVVQYMPSIFGKVKRLDRERMQIKSLYHFW